jgi:hypothetical protein
MFRVRSSRFDYPRRIVILSERSESKDLSRTLVGLDNVRALVFVRARL